MKRPLVAIFSLFFFTFLIIFSEYFYNRGWTAFTSYGGIYGMVFKKGNNLIYGTDYSRLVIADTKNLNNLKSIDLNIGTVIPQHVDARYVYAIAGDTFWKVDIKKQKPLWSFTEKANFTFERSELKKGRVYLTSKGGSFYVINAKNGSLIWESTGHAVKTVEDKIIDGEVSYAPDFWIYQGRVYLMNREGGFYSLRLRDGKPLWNFNFNESLPGNFTLYKKRIFVVTKSGKVVALNRSDGKVLWQDQQEMAICTDIYKKSLIGVTYSGQIFTRRAEDGKLLWKSEPQGHSVNCPYKFTSDGIFSLTNGRVFRIDMASGKTKWSKDNFVKSVTPVYQNGVLMKRYFVADLDGKFSEIDSSGNVKWVFDTGHPIYSAPVFRGKLIFIANSAGIIYKISKNTGQPPFFAHLPFSYTTRVDSYQVGTDRIYEITLNTKSTFLNPWAEASLTAEFKSPSGRIIKINGFYYDQSGWKVRFNPPEKGKWEYVLTWNDHGKTYQNKGLINSETGSGASYLKISDINPKRLTLNGKTIFNGAGINDVILDYNGNGSPLDDWATGESFGFNATSSSGITHFRSNNITGLDEYIAKYGPMGAGFNLFRYSIMNANDQLYRDFGHPTVYSNHDTKVADELLLKLRKNGFHIWVTFFNFDIPFKDSLTASQKKILSEYVKYVVARYGVYTDIWELVNEYNARPEVKSFLIGEIKKYDAFDKPISISTPDMSEDPNFPGLGIISPHWYETEKLSDSDTRISAIIDKYASVPKPVVFGEQGNATHNWDSESALRMRVRLWTAFFNQAMVIFWNDSSVKGMSQRQPFFANIFLGEEERKYVKSLQEFTGGYPLSLKPYKINLGNNSVRGYGLEDADLRLGYLYHFTGADSPITVSFLLNNKKSGTIEWFDPESGRVIKKEDCNVFQCRVISPNFKNDVAFRFK